VTWRAFELDPSALPHRDRDPNQTQAQRLSRKYGMSLAEAQQRIAQLVALAAAEGLAFDFDHIKPGNTFDTHRLLHLARERGRGDALTERVMSAYLCEGRALDASELLPLVADAGLDVDEAQAVLATGGYAAEVRADEREAKELGIQGVPFFRIGRYGVSGAQPTELFVGALGRAWAELPEPLVSDGGDEANVCGPDGCR
jgi:predicted DsbA family dithiol-disulfide isomerase